MFTTWFTMSAASLGLGLEYPMVISSVRGINDTCSPPCSLPTTLARTLGSSSVRRVGPGGPLKSVSFTRSISRATVSINEALLRICISVFIFVCASPP